LFESHNVALVDNLPAGAEAINPEMARLTAKKHAEEEKKRLEALGQKLPTPTEGDAKSPSSTDSPTSWIQHENYRDSRVEVFAGKLNDNQSYTYTFEFRYDQIISASSCCTFAHKSVLLYRAVFAGTYLAPPARAEEMYQPGICGSSETLRVDIYN